MTLLLGTPLFIGTPELILIVIIALLLFGGKRIPELMRGLGKGIRSFKDGMNSIDDNNDSTVDESSKRTDSDKPKNQE